MTKGNIENKSKTILLSDVEGVFIVDIWLKVWITTKERRTAGVLLQVEMAPQEQLAARAIWRLPFQPT